MMHPLLHEIHRSVAARPHWPAPCRGPAINSSPQSPHQEIQESSRTPIISARRAPSRRNSPAQRRIDGRGIKLRQQEAAPPETRRDRSTCRRNTAWRGQRPSWKRNVFSLYIILDGNNPSWLESTGDAIVARMRMHLRLARSGCIKFY